MVREVQNIDLYRVLRTTLANLADHQWSAEQTLGITALECHVLILWALRYSVPCPINLCRPCFSFCQMLKVYVDVNVFDLNIGPA